MKGKEILRVRVIGEGLSDECTEESFNRKRGQEKAEQEKGNVLCVSYSVRLKRVGEPEDS